MNLILVYRFKRLRDNILSIIGGSTLIACCLRSNGVLVEAIVVFPQFGAFHVNLGV